MIRKPIRRALITGASSGIGEEFARQLATAGTSLVLVARRRDRLESLAAELRKAHRVETEVLEADLSRDEDLARVEARIAGIPDLDLLVNNAGFSGLRKFIESDIGIPLEMIRVQLVTPVRLVRAVLDGMLARNCGGIINVASVAAFSPLSGTTYAAVKGFLVRFSEGLRLELLGSGVRVQALCPGLTHTEFHDSMPGFKDSFPRFLWTSAARVVRVSLRTLGRRRVVCVPGGLNRIVVFLMKCPATAALMTAAAGLKIARRHLKG